MSPVRGASYPCVSAGMGDERRPADAAKYLIRLGTTWTATQVLHYKFYPVSQTGRPDTTQHP